MLAELKNESQITFSAEIIKNLGISEGDKFEIVQKDIISIHHLKCTRCNRLRYNDQEVHT